MDSAQTLHDLQIQKKKVSRISYVSAVIIFCIVLIWGNRLLPSIRPDTYNALLMAVALVGLVLAYLLALKMRTLDDKIRVATVKDILEEQLRTEGFKVTPYQEVAETLAADVVASIGNRTFLIEVKSSAGLGLTVMRRPETSATRRYLVVVSPTSGTLNKTIVESGRQAGVEVLTAQGPSDAKKLAQELVNR